MRRSPLSFLASALLAMVNVIACTTSTPKNRLPAVEDEDTDDAPSKTRKDAGSIDDLPPGADPPLPDGGKPPGQIFAHTKNELYRFDPLANTLTAVGPMTCVPKNETKPFGSVDNDAVLDLAIDRTGQMYATTYWRFLKVDPTSGGCTVIRTGTLGNQYPNSLSFVPTGNGLEEVLVGYAFDDLHRATIFTAINLATGEMIDRDDLNPEPPLGGVEYGISGDVISLTRTNGKTYAAVKQVSGAVGTGNDILAEIDPSTGTLKAILGDTGQKGFYGMGFWAGKAYGFTSQGSIYEIDVQDGSSKIVLEAKDPNGLALEWYGAGVTTDAPTAP